MYDFDQEINANMRNSGNIPGYILWLSLGILQILTLCCFNYIAVVLGIIAVILIILANSEFKKGKIIRCKKKINIAKILIVISITFTLVTLVIDIIAIILSIIK